jgi:hypothetical protein
VHSVVEEILSDEIISGMTSQLQEGYYYPKTKAREQPGSFCNTETEEGPVA